MALIDHECRRPDDEHGLVQAAQADLSTFDALYAMHEQRVYRYVRALVATDQDAEDLTQQVFLRALEGMQRFSGRSKFVTWLLRIAHNVVIDAERRRHAALSWDSLPEASHPIEQNRPDDHILWHETIEQLHMLLTWVDPEKRKLLMLRFAAQLSIAEIAEVVHKRPDAVKKQIARALQILKEHNDEF